MKKRLIQRSLSAKIGLWFTVLMFTILVPVSILSYQQNRTLLLENAQASLRFEAEEKAIRFIDEMARIEKDVLFLAATPPIQGIVRAVENDGVDPQEKRSTEVLQARLADIFANFMAQHENYFQMRFIGGRDKTMAWVRVERALDGTITQVPVDKLQEQSLSTPDTQRQPPGGIFLSRIHLNREHGQISEPHMPTMRIATPIYDKGAPFGLIVIHINLTASFKRFTSTFPWPAKISLVDREGMLLAHPEPDKTFGTDLDNGYGLSTEHPFAWKILTGFKHDSDRAITDHVTMHGENIQFTGWFHLGPFGHGPEIGVTIDVPESEILRELAHNQVQFLFYAVFAMALGVIFVWFLAQRIVRPLMNIHTSIQAFGQGEDLKDLPVHLQDERGELARAFHAMQPHMEERVKERTKELMASNHSLHKEMDNHRVTQARLFIANQIFEKATQAILISDARNVIQDVNPSYVHLTGFKRKDVIGKTPSVSKSGRHDKTFYQAMWRSLEEKNHWEGEIWDRRASGDIYPKYLTIYRITGAQGEVLNYVAMFQDITEQKATEEELERRTHYDLLTGLPNRGLFRNRLEYEFEVADRQQCKVALFSLNLDRFKQINDSFGHLVGDTLLSEVAQRLENVVRRTDLVARKSQLPERDADVVSRLDSDAFAFILADLKDGESAVAVARRTLKKMEEPFLISGYSVFVTCSIGIAIYPDNATTLDGQLLCAERAMEKAKSQGGGRYHFYSDTMNRNSMEKVKLEANMRQAIRNEAFLLHYQPKLDLATGHITSMEALVRWPQPDGGQIYPDSFIPLAENTGLIVPLGEWILFRAIEDTMRLNEQSGWNLKVAVNLSARQFQQPNLVNMVRATMQETEIPPHQLELEITESMVMTDHDHVIGVMKSLRDLGLTLSIDDFGTGYSSLAYLRKFPVNALKIDQSFVRDLVVDSEDASIVQAICSMARSLGLNVVAEGVETQEQLQFLRENRCELAQGYHISRPVPEDLFRTFVKNWTPSRMEGSGERGV